MSTDDLKAAVSLHQQSRLVEAEARYRALLATTPADPEALRLLGLCRFQQGDLEEARSLIALSCELKGDNPDTHNGLGVVLLDLGHREEALRHLDAAIALRPGHAAALVNRARALEELGRPDEALACLDEAARAGLHGPVLSYNRGLCLQRAGRHLEAVAAFDEALVSGGPNSRALTNRGEALRSAGMAAAAAESFRHAIALDPTNALAHNGLGALAHADGRFDDALACYEAAITHAPANPHGHANKGRALGEVGRREEGVRSLESAAALAPADPQVLADLGSALLAIRRYEEGRARLRAALTISPSLAHARGDLLHADLQVCAWDRVEEDTKAIASEIESGALAAVPFTLLSMPVSPQTQRRCAELFVSRHYPIQSPPLWNGERYAHGRIRIGYFSADFHDHPTAHLLTEVLERHDRERFEISAYSFGRASQDRWRTRIVDAVERFHDVRDWSHREIATHARANEIDIAVDLKGFTLGNRTAIFALRPAPVQVNYLGYPGTMGAPYIDYLIADRTLVPAEYYGHFAERVVYLPNSYQPNDRSRHIAESPVRRADFGLPEAGFVFCCFNNFFKITPPVFDAWMRILREVPGAVLWLLRKNLSGESNLRVAAQARGVSPDRLVFSPDLDLASHLARHSVADLFLDTLPCNAHTTASDSLWAGLPVLTCMGDTFAGRVTASLLNAAGLPELVTHSLAEYEAAALRLAGDTVLLQTLRDRLLQTRLVVPLFNATGYTRHLECAYTRMWERQQQGRAPAPIEVPGLS